MRSTGPINVMFAASVSAAVAGTFAVCLVPALAFLCLMTGSPPADGSTEYGMTLAVVTPLCCAVAGFILGGSMASIANTLVKPSFRPAAVVKEKSLETYAGSVIDAA